MGAALHVGAVAQAAAVGEPGAPVVGDAGGEREPGERAGIELLDPQRRAGSLQRAHGDPLSVGRQVGADEPALPPGVEHPGVTGAVHLGHGGHAGKGVGGEIDQGPVVGDGELGDDADLDLDPGQDGRRRAGEPVPAGVERGGHHRAVGTHRDEGAVRQERGLGRPGEDGILGLGLHVDRDDRGAGAGVAAPGHHQRAVLQQSHGIAQAARLGRRDQHDGIPAVRVHGHHLEVRPGVDDPAVGEPDRARQREAGPCRPAGPACRRRSRPCTAWPRRRSRATGRRARRTGRRRPRCPAAAGPPGRRGPAPRAG